jgi:hypothetical protein
MTQIASDTFNRANQSGWDTSSDGETWAIVRNSFTWNIVSNKGAANSAANFTIARLGSQTPTNSDNTARIAPASANNIGMVARFVDSSNFYYAVFDAGNIVIGKDVAGTFSTLISTAFAITFGTSYHLRFNLNGTTLMLKAWQDGSAEPGSFQLSTTDASLASGGFGVGSDDSGATNTLWDEYVVLNDTLCIAVTPTSLSFGGSGTQNVTLTSCASVSEAWTATILGGSPWLSVSPSSGTLAIAGNATVGITVNATGLNPGTYTDTVQFAVTGQTVNVSVTVIIPAPPPAGNIVWDAGEPTIQTDKFVLVNIGTT